MTWKAAVQRDLLLVAYYSVAVLALLAGVRLRSPLVVLVVFGAFALGGFALRRRFIPRDQVPGAAALWIIAFAFILVGIGVAVLGWNSALSFRVYLVVGGTGMAFIAAGQLLADLRARPPQPGDVRRPLMLGAAYAVSFVSGAVWVLVAPSPYALAPMAFGLLAAPSVLSVLTGRILPTLAKSPWRKRLLIGGLGAALVGAALVTLNWVGVSGAYLIVLSVAVFVLIGGIASDTDLDVLGVVAFLALIASLAPRGVATDRVITPAAGDRVVVAIGDSYMSGEGAHEFYDGTNSVGTDQCRRAPGSYIAEIARDSELIDSTVFVACSGARAIDTVDENGDGIGDRQNQIPKAERAVAEQPITIDSVLISMGGNDAGFAEVAATCLAPGDCTEIGQQLLEQLPETATRLATFFSDVSTAFPAVDRVVLPYPIPITSQGCSWSGFSDDEHAFLVGFTQELNAVVRQEAARAGFHFLAENATVFERQHLRICDSVHSADVGVNFLSRNPADGPAADRLNPQNWIHNTLHPNKRGHLAVAAEMQPFFDVTNRKPWPVVEAESEATWRPRSVEEIVGRPFSHCGGTRAPPYCPSSPTSWALVQTGLTMVRAAIPLVLIASGAWLIWLMVLSIRSGRRQQRG